MSAASSPSELGSAINRSAALSPVRTDASISLSLNKHGRDTRVGRLAERGGYRVRFPNRSDGACEAVVVNTGGGLVGGDRVRIEVATGEGADAVITTSAPERAYRSLGAESEIDVSLRVAGGSRLAWIPQATTMYNAARLQRRFDIDLTSDASALVAEQITFGRVASGEVLRQGLLHDVWRVRRDGRLIFADAQRLEGDIAGLLARPAIGAGARAIGLILAFGERAVTRLEEVRSLLQQGRSLSAASAWGGMLAVRFVASAPEGLRFDLIRVLELLEGRALPRVWQS